MFLRKIVFCNQWSCIFYYVIKIFACVIVVLDAELHEHHAAQVNAARPEFSNTHHGTQGVRRGYARAAGLWL